MAEEGGKTVGVSLFIEIIMYINLCKKWLNVKLLIKLIIIYLIN